MLENNADAAKQAYEGETALHLATARKIAKVVEKVLSAKIDLDIQNRKGQTALHKAAALGLLDVCNSRHQLKNSQVAPLVSHNVILGMPFLTQNNLLIDPVTRTVVLPRPPSNSTSNITSYTAVSVLKFLAFNRLLANNRVE